MAKGKGKQAGKGQNLLGIVGALALLFVAWKFPVPVPGAVHPTTTLLSVTVILLGIFLGWKRGTLIALLYVVAVILSLPPLIWRMQPSSEAFMDIRTNGYVLGLIPAAFLGAYLAPQAHCSYGRLLATILIAHAAYLLCGTAWLSMSEPWNAAIAEGVTSQAVPVLAKSAVGFVVAAVLRRFI